MPNLTSKAELIRNLECTKHTFYITTFGISHFRQDVIDNKSINNHASMPEQLYDYPLTGAHDYLRFYHQFENGEERVDAFTRNCLDAWRAAERTYLNETYEWIKDYVNNDIQAGSNQYATFKNQPWFRMARCVRNAHSHNWLIDFNTYSRNDINDNGNISLYDVDIGLNDEGKSLGEVGWHRGHTVQLCEEMLAFARTLHDVPD